MAEIEEIQAISSPDAPTVDEEAGPADTRCRLLALAGELRNSIYELAVQEPDAIDIAAEQRPERSAEPALSMTCRQIRSECLPVFYDINVFLYRSLVSATVMSPALVANMSNTKHLQLRVCEHPQAHYKLRFINGAWELEAQMQGTLGLRCIVNSVGLAKGKDYLKSVQARRAEELGLTEFGHLARLVTVTFQDMNKDL